jgi:hypothetical protein
MGNAESVECRLVTTCERRIRSGLGLLLFEAAPATAYDRLCVRGLLSRKERSRLRELYASLDPFELKAKLEKGLKKILPAKPV